MQSHVRTLSAIMHFYRAIPALFEPSSRRRPPTVRRIFASFGRIVIHLSNTASQWKKFLTITVQARNRGRDDHRQDIPSQYRIRPQRAHALQERPALPARRGALRTGIRRRPRAVVLRAERHPLGHRDVLHRWKRHPRESGRHRAVPKTRPPRGVGARQPVSLPLSRFRPRTRHRLRVHDGIPDVSGKPARERVPNRPLRHRRHHVLHDRGVQQEPPPTRSNTSSTAWRPSSSSRSARLGTTGTKGR